MMNKLPVKPLQKKNFKMSYALYLINQKNIPRMDGCDISPTKTGTET